MSERLFDAPRTHELLVGFRRHAKEQIERRQHRLESLLQSLTETERAEYERLKNQPTEDEM